jgi:diaminohydroxyphosphoribosylaminopyrimidine deaminase / 5-amino-6-(5-phosphoribosylamino)uracil reductase
MGASGEQFSPEDQQFMRRALVLASKGYGSTSPNPMVGAVLVRNGEIIGEGWHRRAGGPHAEVNAVNSANKRGFPLSGATLYVTLEPCSTVGRTPACTSLLEQNGITRVVVGATDPNPKHAGAAFEILRKCGILVQPGLLANECDRLNEAFNHWIVRRRPFVTLKCAMSLDGKIATNSGESKWITSERSRAYGMRLRVGSDAILCGINTVLRDDPALTIRPSSRLKFPVEKHSSRIILDREARVPLTAKVVSDEQAARTVVAVSSGAKQERVRELEKRVRVLVVPVSKDRRTFKLDVLLDQLGADGITSILIEGGGETHATFLQQRLANRVYFFYAPMIITGRNAPKAISGPRTLNHGKGLRLQSPEWQALGPDLLLSGIVEY